MEILQFLINFLMEEYGKDLSPIYEVFKENDFNIVKSLKNLTPEKIMPLIKTVIKKPPEKKTESVGLTPVSSVADGKIIDSLYKALSN